MDSATEVLEPPADVSAPVGKQREPQTGDDVPPKRLNLNLAPRAFDDLQKLTKRSHQTMTEIVRIGLGLAKIAYEAREKGYRMAVVDSRGEFVREIVIP